MLLILSEKIFLSISFVMCCCIEWQKIIQSTKLCPSYYVHFNPLPYIYIRTQTLVLVNSMWNSQCSFDSKEWKRKGLYFFPFQSSDLPFKYGKHYMFWIISWNLFSSPLHQSLATLILNMKEEAWPKSQEITVILMNRIIAV